MEFAMLRPMIADTIFVHGVKGVKYLYRQCKTPEAWEARKAFLLGRTLEIFRLDRAKAREVPDGKAAFAPRIHDEAAGVIVERFYVETIPGYYLCGNLYVSADPAARQKPMPLIMLAHGHFNRSWDNRDRFFADSQYFGAAFAKRGFLVAAWDMVGLGDDRIDAKSSILEHENKLNTVIQTWNSVRLLSWLLSERFTKETAYQIDERHVAATGASGGGTQAIYLSVLDERVTASIPVVMVSAYFNGDCKCENGVNALRARGIKSNIAERIACYAPKPLLVISDGDDWTRRNPRDETPYLQHIYSLYGAGAKMENFHDAQGVHDYGLVKRQAALDFLLRQWALPADGVFDIPYTEDNFALRPVEELTTFGAASGLARPADYAKSNRELYERITG